MRTQEHIEDAFACGACDAIGILVWRGLPTRERLLRSFDAFDAITRQDERRAMFAVIEDTSPPPDARDFPLIARAFDRLERLGAVVGIFEGRQPWTSLVLDATTAAMALRTRRAPIKLGVDVREGASWLVQRHPSSADAPELAGRRQRLLEAIASVRSRLADR